MNNLLNRLLARSSKVASQSLRGPHASRFNHKRFFLEPLENRRLMTATPTTAPTASYSGQDEVLPAITSTAFFNISPVPSTVTDVNLFYDNSKFNKNVEGVGPSDDKAIDTSKAGYLPGTGTATFANLSSFTHGINGIMVDLTAGGVHSSITADDFSFKVGTNNAPSAWATAPTPSTVSVRNGAGTSGSDRVELTWSDGSIKQEWLEVTVLADANTGLASPYTFFYGSAIANSGTGDTGALAITSSTDENAARNHNGSATVTNVFDYNKDGFVNSSDENAARNNGATIKFVKISLPVIEVSANAQPISDCSTTPSPTNDTDFGNVLVGTAGSNETYTITNSGSAALAVGNVTIGGADTGDFTVTMQPASSVAPGASTSFTVQFLATVAGDRSATVSITENDSTQPNPFTFAISGAAFSGSVDQIATTLQAHGETDTQAATVLFSLGDSANQIASALKDVFNDADATVATILAGLNDTPDEIAGAIRDVFGDADIAVGVDGGVDVEFNNGAVYFSPNGLNLAGGGSTQLAYDGTQGAVPARRR